MDLIKKQLDLCYNRNAYQQARQPPRNVFTGRKVRAPQSRMPGNARPRISRRLKNGGQGEEQGHRDESAARVRPVGRTPPRFDRGVRIAHGDASAAG